MTEATSAWRDVTVAIRRNITSGRYCPGMKLPTQSELSRAHNASRHSVRRALSALERDGLIQCWQGKGTFVRCGRVDYALGPSTRFSDNAAHAGFVPGAELLSTRRKPAPHRIAELLGLTPRDSVIVIEILRLADGAPLALARHHVDAARFPNFANDFRETSSISEALRRGGVAQYSRTSTTIEARTGTAHETTILGIPPIQPVLVSCAQNVDGQQQPVEVSIAVSRGDRLTFAVAAG